MDNRILIVVVMVIVAGVIGGIINYYSADPEQKNRNYLWKAIFSGIGAALLIPLFLRTISSNLLSSIFGNNINYDDYLVFFGFCLLASISARAFIQALSQKVYKDLQEAKDKVNKVDTQLKSVEKNMGPLLDYFTEPDSDTEVTKEINIDLKNKTNDLDNAILQAIDSHPRLALRSVTGIKNEISKMQPVSKTDVEKGLEKLADGDLLYKIEGKEGLRWAITHKGKALLDNH
jgi:YEATS-Like-Associating Three TM